MTTHEKLTRRKQSLLELAEYLQNVSQACKINGVFRQHFSTSRKPMRSRASKVFERRPDGSPA